MEIWLVQRNLRVSFQAYLVNDMCSAVEPSTICTRPSRKYRFLLKFMTLIETHGIDGIHENSLATFFQSTMIISTGIRVACWKSRSIAKIRALKERLANKMNEPTDQRHSQRAGALRRPVRGVSCTGTWTPLAGPGCGRGSSVASLGPKIGNQQFACHFFLPVEWVEVLRVNLRYLRIDKRLFFFSTLL